ncbi:MAG: GNAT family N-acetyltransferase [Leptolyngbyaceae cyanobacterium SM1_1_3]|nr:GNAT family N-acetyltransferase [Leptolyngbyaceae cyanobacterium SM1_1_3]NJN04613.1 GNAT family N-acetyltransferase [Leptolyngbyaceae cyanobacterium RM1_1_2]NJO11031.1 GNAT family N-acetyltransferase [Leptolyngbyaceae cyanobacterium SL_1_1]
MDMILKLAQTDDLAVLLPLVQDYHAFEQISLPLEPLKQALLFLVETETAGRIWLIQQSAETVGYITLCFGYSIEFLGRDAFIDEFFIMSSRRGQGLGTAVLEHLQIEAQQLGVKALHLEVAKDNPRSQRLYRATGFRPRERYILMSQQVKIWLK